MNKWILRLGALGLAAVVVLGVAASASAQGPGSGPNWLREPGERIGQRLLDTVAEATGLPVEDILTRLRDGESLADIAEANGIDPQTIVDEVKAELSAEIEAAVKDGRLREFAANRLSARLDAALERAMNASLPGWFGAAHGHFQEWLDATLAGVIADLAGVDLNDLLDEHFTLPSLEEVAESYGLDPEAVLSAAEARTTEAINEAVAEGVLTQEQADALLDGLGERLERRFEASFGPLCRGMAGRWGTRWGGPGRMWR